MDANEVKKLAKTQGVILGSDRVLKLLRENQMESVYLAKNAPKVVAEDVIRYAQLNGTTCEVLDIPNDELGILCKKPFNVAVIGIKKAVVSAKKRH